MENKSQQGGGADEWDATQWHVVQKGETLSKIAEQYYGDPNLYPKIFEANRDILKDPNLIRVGQKLRVPRGVKEEAPMIERWWASVTSAFVGVLIATVTMTGCATDKGPAQAAIAAAETAVNSTLAEASKYVPDQAQSLQAGLTAAKEKFNKGDYAAASTEAKAVAEKANQVATAASARKA